MTDNRSSHGTASRRGLRLDPDMSFETWEVLGAQLSVRSEASSWWLGDWLVFGKQQYRARYKSVIAVTGLDYQTLRNYAVVAKRFPVSRRRDNISFQHHAELCAMSDAEQDRWLDLVAAEGWSKRELRLRVRGATRPKRLTTDSRVSLSVDPAREQRWREAAERTRSSFEHWMGRALDAAAQVDT